MQFAICNLFLLTAGCDMLDMYDEPRFEPLEASTFFDDGTSARPLVAGTVARGELREDEAFYSGKEDGKYVIELPLELTRELLVRGQERFNIYCSPCHGRVGDGNGMIVQRGFRRPPSFVSSDRLLNSPVGHFYDVISNGFGAMPSYASRVDPHDRWAIVAYIRTLQRSQNGSVDDVPADLRDEIAESEAVEEEERKQREAAEQLDTERQRKIERNIREHGVPPKEGERKHREIEREGQGKENSNKLSAFRLPLSPAVPQIKAIGRRSREAASFDSQGWSAAQPWVASRANRVSPERASFLGAPISIETDRPVGQRCEAFFRLEYTQFARLERLVARTSPSKNPPNRANCLKKCFTALPVGANNGFIGSDNPGLRCAAPWTIEYGPFGVGGLA